ncbi:MAG: Energy-coupling factor transporter ATP-binding protein EcfA1 [Pelotomaculum sp. PtaB.Bin013]|uniref:Energy-coupling factor ABC transporter ATP-binding protein n=1 Tax=Pelotomaculum isophthalicicum JI TaxID=947010 RepID=A0A9X4JVV5_9FIRM|nr:ABC transporter ATP-binding protein [Pelotomaculum isophthalicicum]MDF9409026.1 energy-coupling factor ABC transporter ATP-binding protein [Pelotomaculum isophthalicicum JI]OPX91355.1 MAG: Energy-coupling factor transporter ATP-binding protein EcfA1 [Pelotomaculum sp. PtaB.Bin013]
MDAIVVDNLTYKYPAGREILKNLDFRVRPGEIVAVIGLSGCGKSTLCLCLGGIIPHYLGGELTGQVWVNGKNTREYKVAQLALEVGLVFQDPDTQLFSATVEDEIAFAPENLCLPVEVVRERVNSVLEMLGISDLRQNSPSNLSGGQKHLVAMGAVLALDPAILVLDEVMAQQDSLGKKTIKDILVDLRRQGKTILIVEHDLESVSIADRVLVLEGGFLIRDGQAANILEEREFLIRQKLAYEV